MNVKELCYLMDEDLLNFSLEGEEQQGSVKAVSEGSSSLEYSETSETTTFSLDTHSGSFSGFVEEELEWLSNKDAFPEVELGILTNTAVSVLANISSDKWNTKGNDSSLPSYCQSLEIPITHPVRPRSRRQRKRKANLAESTSQAQSPSLPQVMGIKESSFMLPASPTTRRNGGGIGRRCLHCQAEKTPQWRAGPKGPKTLCNACGVRFKLGRLLPEYRPVSSPTFSSALHSNSHRKVVEMRRQKQLPTGGGDGDERGMVALS